MCAFGPLHGACKCTHGLAQPHHHLQTRSRAGLTPNMGRWRMRVLACRGGCLFKHAVVHGSNTRRRPASEHSGPSRDRRTGRPTWRPVRVGIAPSTKLTLLVPLVPAGQQRPRRLALRRLWSLRRLICRGQRYASPPPSYRALPSCSPRQACRSSHGAGRACGLSDPVRESRRASR